MDGVITNFIYGAMETLDLPYESYNFGKYNGFGKYQSELWKRINEQGEDFWINLPEFLDVKAFYNKLSKYGKVYICTASGKYPSTCAGKLYWLQNRLGKKFKDYVFINDKYLLANENSILIDDCEENIEKFIICGGNTFHWYSNWKSINFNNEDINNNVEDLFLLLKDLKKREIVIDKIF